MFLIDMTQEMCYKVILENGGTLNYVPDYYKIKDSNKVVVDNYVHTLEILPDCYNTKKMCNTAINTSPSAIQFLISKRLKKMCDKAVDACLFAFNYFPDQYKTEEILINLFPKILLW